MMRTCGIAPPIVTSIYSSNTYVIDAVTAVVIDIGIGDSGIAIGYIDAC